MRYSKNISDFFLTKLWKISGLIYILRKVTTWRTLENLLPFARLQQSLRGVLHRHLLLRIQAATGTDGRTHARTHARHRAVAGVSMSPFFFGLGGLQNGPGGTHRSISRAFWRGVPRKQPSRTIGRFIASRSAATCSSTGARVRAQKRRTELKAQIDDHSREGCARAERGQSEQAWGGGGALQHERLRPPPCPRRHAPIGSALVSIPLAISAMEIGHRLDGLVTVISLLEVSCTGLVW